jgi:hypothetical protein
VVGKKEFCLRPRRCVPHQFHLVIQSAAAKVSQPSPSVTAVGVSASTPGQFFQQEFLSANAVLCFADLLCQHDA